MLCITSLISERVLIKDKVLMIGVNPSSVGGVASVIRSIQKSKIYTNIEYIYSNSVSNNLLLKIYAMMYSYCKFLYLLIVFRPKYIHVHTSSYSSFKRKLFFMELSSFFRIQYIVHIHGGSFIAFFDGSGFYLKSRIRVLLGGAKKVVCVSPQFESEIRSRFELSESCVVPNFVYPISLNRINEYRSNHLFEKKYLLFMGDISDAKGFSDAVALTSRLRAVYPAVTLQCAGNPDKEYFDSIVGAQKASDFVFYHGVVKGELKNQLMRDAYFLVSPSKIESFGMSNLEAALMGVPVLAYSVGGVPSVISNGINGCLVGVGQWGDFVKFCSELIDNEVEYKRLISICYDNANLRFSLESIGMLYEKIYQ
mgnify:CR=1 FL=1